MTTDKILEKVKEVEKVLEKTSKKLAFLIGPPQSDTSLEYKLDWYIKALKDLEKALGNKMSVDSTEALSLLQEQVEILKEIEETDVFIDVRVEATYRFKTKLNLSCSKEDMLKSAAVKIIDQVGGEYELDGEEQEKITIDGAAREAYSCPIITIVDVNSYETIAEGDIDLNDV